MMEILQGATTDVDVDEMSMMNNQSGKRQPVPGVSDPQPSTLILSSEIQWSVVSQLLLL
jgi:hypothetical protein